MGACDFEDFGAGKTPQEAFRAAVEQARWEHGHGGYTGTIAEKHNFVLVDLPPRVTTSMARDLWNLDEKVGWAQDWLKKMRGLTEDSWDFQRRYGADKELSFDDWKAKKIKDAQTKVRKLKALQKKHPALAQRITSLAEDKWGPAVCVEMTGKEAKDFRDRTRGSHKRGTRFFAFFGLASS